MWVEYLGLVEGVVVLIFEIDEWFSVGLDIDFGGCCLWVFYIFGYIDDLIFFVDLVIDFVFIGDFFYLGLFYVFLLNSSFGEYLKGLEDLLVEFYSFF